MSLVHTSSRPSSPSDASPAPMRPRAAWEKTPETVLTTLWTPREGLSETEATQRMDVFGRNALRTIETVPAWQVLINQLTSLVVALLAAAAGVAAVFGDWIEAGAIGVVLLINTAIGFVMEWRAVRSMEALREIDRVEAVVRRGGRTQRIPAETVVPGDILLLDEGDVVTADLRLLRTSKLQIDESALTGESVPVEKDEAAVEAETTLAERTSMAYKGTAVTRGSGEGVVVATGMDTELGEISALVESAQQDATPLEERLDQLAHSLVAVVLVLAAAVTALGFASGRDLKLMVEMGIALAVAAIPEGLPIVATIALARGLRRMARRNALVRRLSSVETLGATSVICTDKTGTLTENRMRVRRVLLPNDPIRTVALDGPGHDAREGEPETDASSGTDALRDGALGNGVVDPSAPDTGDATDVPDALDGLDGRMALAAWVSALCTTASLAPDDPSTFVGDPMEGALLQFAHRTGHAPAPLAERFPETDRIAFDRDTKMMASLRSADDGVLVVVKGAPETVLAHCTHEVGAGAAPLDCLAGDAVRPLDDARREAWVDANQAQAADGLRVLGLAAKVVPASAALTSDSDANPDAVYDDLTFVGLVGLVDPPRADVKDAIASCRNAGIRVVMVTGDQPATARYIAHAVGMIDAPDVPVVHGADFDALLEDDGDRITGASVFARVTPRQKLDLIDLHQARGHIVAMTGDGVNDAPALKSADIGVAMGQRGTQVAQEAADVVLEDDAFSTIVAAVEEGRAIFNNIRAFVRYLLSCNVGEVMVVAVAALAGMMLPILPLQILFLNLVTDVFPALALGVGEAETDVMAHRPRDADEPVLTKRHWMGIAAYGVVFVIAVLGTMLIARDGMGLGPAQTVTASFLTLAFAQLWHVFSMRSPDAHPIRNVVVQNPYVWGALALCSAILLLAVHVPTLARVLSVTPLPLDAWGLVLGASLLPFLAGQIGLWVRRSRGRTPDIGAGDVVQDTNS